MWASDKFDREFSKLNFVIYKFFCAQKSTRSFYDLDQKLRLILNALARSLCDLD